MQKVQGTAIDLQKIGKDDDILEKEIISEYGRNMYGRKN